MKTNLEKFYQLVADDPTLAQQFESITDRDNFLKLVVQIGAKRGYNFTISLSLDSLNFPDWFSCF